MAEGGDGEAVSLIDNPEMMRKLHALAVLHNDIAITIKGDSVKAEAVTMPPRYWRWNGVEWEAFKP